MRRIIGAAALAGMLTLSAVATALAGPPQGGCPPGGRWALGSTGDFGPLIAGTDPDLNGDGQVCGFEAPEGGGIYTIVDNVMRAH